MKTSSQAIAFDLDDTLYHESDYVDSCLRHVASVSPDPERAISAMLGQKDPYAALRAAWPEWPLALDEFLSIYRSTAPASLPMRSDATVLLEYLAGSHPDIPLYLITDGRREGQRNKIEALSLNRFFPETHIIISAETGYDKTTPFPFATAMMRDGSPRQWTYVGDNPAKDFRWPNLMGWHTVMLQSTPGTTVHPQTIPDAPEYAPEHIITTLLQLPHLLFL